MSPFVGAGHKSSKDLSVGRPSS